MAKELKEKLEKKDIEDFLEGGNDSYKFELEVLAEIHRTMGKLPGFEAWHGGHYLDPVENKQRQFDIRVEFTLADQGICEQKVYASIECKGLDAGTALIAHSSARLEEEAQHSCVVTLDARPKIPRPTYLRAKPALPEGQASR